MQDLNGKVAFVTGAASGIGFHIAHALAQAGVKVMLCDIEEDALATAVAKLSSTYLEIDGCVADVSLKQDLQAAADATIARFGKVHILINNAGVFSNTNYGHWTDAGWNWTIGVNLLSVVWGIEIFCPLMEAHGEGGQVVSTASVAGLFSGGPMAYNVTKAGVVGLSEGLREPMAKRNIGISLLCPGPVRTKIHDAPRNFKSHFSDEGSETLGASELDLDSEWIRLTSEGLEPAYVGELVREGIEKDWAYIFTETDFEPYIAARFAAIRDGFDRIRGRAPAS